MAVTHQLSDISDFFFFYLSHSFGDFVIRVDAHAGLRRGGGGGGATPSAFGDPNYTLTPGRLRRGRDRQERPKMKRGAVVFRDTLLDAAMLTFLSARSSIPEREAERCVPRCFWGSVPAFL